MNKTRLIFGISVVLAVALLLSVSAAAFPFFGKQTAQLNITSNETLSTGDELVINLTGSDGKAIANETVNVTFIDDNGVKENFSAVADENGTAKLKIDKNAGKYTVNCTFAGNNDFEAASALQNLTVEDNSYEDYSDESDSTGDPGAFYSAQEGRIIYTGEVHGAPDGNRYRHLGYNEWELVE